MASSGCFLALLAWSWAGFTIVSRLWLLTYADAFQEVNLDLLFKLPGEKKSVVVFCIWIMVCGGMSYVVRVKNKVG